MPRRRTTRPERTIQTRNTARGPNPFGQQAFQGGLSRQGRAERGPADMRCPTGQKPVKGPDGKMTCQNAGPSKPKIRNNGAY